jgi:hypothetical protein
MDPSIQISYNFIFPDGDAQTFDLRLDTRTLNLSRRRCSDIRFATRYQNTEFSDSTPRCSSALDLAQT